MELVAQRVLAVVCPVSDETDMAGIGVFTTSPDEVRAVLDQDPAIVAGILSYTVHPCRGFPGAMLPE